MAMQNLKYHIINTVSILIFSYSAAATVSQAVKYRYASEPSSVKIKTEKKHMTGILSSFDDYSSITESGFFLMSDSVGGEAEGAETARSVDDMTLMGTITGPSSIARAMIQKKGDKYPRIFSLVRISSEINNNVFGYTLVSIDTKRVYLEKDGERKVLDLYTKKDDTNETGSSGGIESGTRIKRTISRSEIKQKVLNNMDNALKGLRAGPYRVGGKIEGYRLVKIRPYNILYKLGARSGDIVKRINGHSIDSTQKLYNMWESLKNESKITVDLERRGQLMTFDLNISE